MVQSQTIRNSVKIGIVLSSNGLFEITYQNQINGDIIKYLFFLRRNK